MKHRAASLRQQSYLLNNRPCGKKYRNKGFSEAYRCMIRLCVLSDVQGHLTKTPQNVVVLRGQDAILNCSTDDAVGQDTITWYHDNNIIVSPGCHTHYDLFITILPDATTGCNIRALASYEHGISGSYRCSSDRTQAVATVIVHGERHNYIISC